MTITRNTREEAVGRALYEANAGITHTGTDPWDSRIAELQDNYRRLARAAIAALPAADGGWRPIDDEAKDGTPVDLWCVHPAHGGMRSPDMRWEDRAWRNWLGERLNPGWDVTHYRPLPLPPVPQSAEDEVG